jgi:hypothetical protein
VRDDLTVVEVHAGRQTQLLAVRIELGNIVHPLLVWRGRAEIALQNIGYVRVVHALDASGTLLRPDQRSQLHLLYQPLQAFVVYGFRR